VRAHTEQDDSATRYPRVYEIGGRRTINGIALCFVCIGIVLPLLRILLQPGELVKASNVLPPAFGLLTIAIFIGWAANRRVILYVDAIELKSWLFSRRLSVAQIAGYWIEHPRSKRGTYRYVIALRNPGRRPMKLPYYLRYNKDFYAWLRGIARIDRATTREVRRRDPAHELPVFF